MQPINKYLIINEIDEQLETQSGLLLSGADNNNFRYKKGQVVKPGTNVEYVKDGDIIYYDRNAGYSMIIDSSKYTVILERDIVVVL